ncbi:hypothetical protein NKH77_18810 [Streptomyces sp. M19]
MIDRLARPRGDGTTSPLQSELARIPDQRRRRALLLVGSYAEAGVAATALDEIPRWRGRFASWPPTTRNSKPQSTEGHRPGVGHGAPERYDAVTSPPSPRTRTPNCSSLLCSPSSAGTTSSPPPASRRGKGGGVRNGVLLGPSPPSSR